MPYIFLIQNGELGNGIFDDNNDLNHLRDNDESELQYWAESEVLKISNCNSLELNLYDDIQEDMGIDDGKQTILIVENIKQLTLEFELGNEYDGRVGIISL